MSFLLASSFKENLPSRLPQLSVQSEERERSRQAALPSCLRFDSWSSMDTHSPPVSLSVLWKVAWGWPNREPLPKVSGQSGTQAEQVGQSACLTAGHLWTGIVGGKACPRSWALVDGRCRGQSLPRSWALVDGRCRGQSCQEPLLSIQVAVMSIGVDILDRSVPSLCISLHLSNLEGHFWNHLSTLDEYILSEILKHIVTV